MNVPTGFIHTTSTVVTNSARGNDSIRSLHEPDGQGAQQDMKVSEPFNNRRGINVNLGHISSSNSKGELKDEMALVNDKLQASAAPESFLAGETDFLDLAKQSESVGEKSVQQELKSDYEELIGGKSRDHGGNQKNLKLNTNANSDKEVESKSKNSRQAVKRSNVIAKQVISKTSALSMGFVSQLWVDTTSWTVEVVEIRPSLLSGEMERIVLQELCQVGDVILVEDENMLDNEPAMIGLDSLGLWEAPTMHANGWNDAMVRKSSFKTKNYVRHNRMDDELEKELKLLSRKRESNKGFGKRSTIKESKVKDEWEPPLDY